MKMCSMERSDKQDHAMPVSCEADKYPYGLRLHLDDECVRKLGIKELPAVGTKFEVQAVAIVCDVSEHMKEGKDETRKSITLQICEMGASPKSEKKSASDTIYEKE